MRAPRIPPLARRAIVLFLALAAAPAPASAICDVIPGAAAEFRSALGATNRPYAGPGDFLEVAVRSAVCDDESTGLGPAAADNFVTVLFTPPGAPVSAVVLATDCGLLSAGTCVGGGAAGAPCLTNGECGGGACSGPSALAACQAQLGSGGTASCLPALPGDLGLERDGVSERLTFRFPDTDAAVDGPGDDRTLAGPAKVVVTPDTKPLACGAAQQACAALPRQSAAACIDRFFALDGSCGTAPSQLARPFSGFTALPNANDYQKMCESSDPTSPCTPDPGLEVRFTVDRDGNVLVPMNWRGVRLFQDGNPVARLAQGETSIDAFAAGLLAGSPIDVPGDSFVASFAPNGFPVAPAFTPVADETSAAKLFGSVDADRGVMRIARRSASLRECLDPAGQPPTPAGVPCNGDEDCPGGLACGDPGTAFCRNRGTQVRSAQTCDTDADCSAPGEECGPALFAFEGRGTGTGKGPVVIPNADFAATVGTPVPLEGLIESDAVFAFGLSEPLDGQDRNGDLDAVDFIATLGDKQGGLGALLSPVVRLRDGRFRYPALDVEGNVLAYLEPEQGRLFEFEGAIPEPACILNGDGDCFDSLPRVFRQPPGGGSPEEVFVGSFAADAQPIVNGKSIAVMDGRVFFRSSEPDQAPRVTERVSLRPGGSASPLPAYPQDVGGDGTRVAFTSQDRLVAAKLGGQRDAFVRDRSSGQMLWVSPDRFGGDSNGDVKTVRLSADGQLAFFESDATDLVPETEGDDSGLRRLFVRDLAAGATTLLPIGGSGLPSADALLDDVSADGRFVAFRSAASELFGGDPVPQDVHVYRFDVATGATELVDGRFGSPGNGDAEDAALSEDGRFVAFVSAASDLLPVGDDANGSVPDAFVRDMALADGIELASLSTTGAQANAPSVAVSLSPDGRVVGFSSYATNLDAHSPPIFGTTVFVRDRGADVTFAVQQLAGPVGAHPDLGHAGRYLAATSDVLVGMNPFLFARSLFRSDLLTGIVELVDVLDSVPLEPFVVLERALLSGDGHTTLFSDLGPMPGKGAFVKSFDDGAAAGDLSGDGDARDSLLVTLDSGEGGAEVVCPAGKVDLGDGYALFLRPERDGETVENPVCPGSTGGVSGDFSGDGDAMDDVVHLRLPGGIVRNLELASGDVAVTGSVAAALGSEAGERRPGQSDAEASFNGDADALDEVLFVAPVDGVFGRSDWTAVPRAGKALDASGDLVGLLSCEAAQGGVDETDDGDTADCSLQLYDALALTDPAAGGLLDLADAEGRQRPAEDFVMGPAERRCVAAASPATACAESADCPAGSFCGAEGACVAVLAEPASCASDGDCAAGASCERDLVVAFRGAEADLCAAPPGACGGVPPGCASVAECDRNGDGDCCDDALFAYDRLQGRVVASGQAITPCGLQACDPRLPYRVFTSSATVRFLTEEQAQGGQDLDADGTTDDLVVQVWNVRSGAVVPVASVADDPDPGPNDPTVDPLAGGSALDPGTQIFSSFGLCIESLESEPCPPDGFLEDGVCKVVHGVCVGDDDCPPGIPCDRTRRITVGVADVDGDGLPDPVDNCPDTRNADQGDTDGDAQGDACDVRICGDGDLDPGEQCDDANLEDGDGCSRFCQSEQRVCDANGDGSVDQRDISKILRDRNQTALTPYDPRDVDLDGEITVLDSRTCVRECDRPTCAPPTTVPAPGCGLLGGEALLALLPFWLLRRRAGARRAGLALAAVLAVLGGAPAEAVTLSLAPPAQGVAVGGSFDLELVVADLGDGAAPSLGGFDVALSFDPSLLSLDAVNLGSLLGDEGAFESFSDVVFGAGGVGIAQTSFLDALSLDLLQPGSFTLASLSFTALAPGTSAVAFGSASLADGFGAPLAFTSAGAQVTAGGVIPEPAASLLFGLGALAVVAALRRRAGRR